MHQIETLSPQETNIVQLGHVVRLRIDDEEPERYLLLDGPGGITIGDVTTLSVGTPIGGAIHGTHVGSTAKANVPGGQLEVEILSVE